MESWSHSVAIFAVIVMPDEEERYCRQKEQRPFWEAAGSHGHVTAIADCSLDIALSDHDYRVLRRHDDCRK
jgi:hypothetical protein